MADTCDHTCRYSLQRFPTTTAGCAYTPWYECEESYPRSSAWSRVNLPKPLNRSASIDIFRVTRRDCDVGKQTALKKQRFSLRGVYVWGVNSTLTKHSDYFFRKDTSERVTRRLDDTSWQDASGFMCIKTLLFTNKQTNKRTFFWGRSAAKNPPEPPGILSLTRY